MKELDAWLSAINAQTAGQPRSQVERDPPDIKDFGCVTCCDAQWPDLGKHTAYKMRFKSFSNLLKRFGSTVKAGEAFNWDPVQYLSTLLRSDFLEGKLRWQLLGFLRRTTKAKAPQYPGYVFHDIMTLDSKEGTLWDYSLLQIQARCLVWICHETLDLEARLLARFGAKLANAESKFQRSRERCAKMPFVFVPHVLLARFTDDMVVDISTIFSGGNGVPELAYNEILSNPRDMCLNFVIDSNLRGYFQRLTPGNPRCNNKVLDANVKLVKNIMQ
ncbi:hypothetical protein PG993_009281 [Apiospora rasikravindrae]|uniref:PH domain-containing protein n=1 Tax=Apiospora rasikravindrae TaxID=990691 RepID=A0ABR1SIZ2_9PEZI